MYLCSVCTCIQVHVYVQVQYMYLCMSNCLHQDERRLWNAYHILVFVAMGAVGGLLGALFNSINTQITIYRLKYLLRRSKFWRCSTCINIHLHNTV